MPRELKEKACSSNPSPTGLWASPVIERKIFCWQCYRWGCPQTCSQQCRYCETALLPHHHLGACIRSEERRKEGVDVLQLPNRPAALRSAKVPDHESSRTTLTSGPAREEEGLGTALTSFYLAWVGARPNDKNNTSSPSSSMACETCAA